MILFSDNMLVLSSITLRFGVLVILTMYCMVSTGFDSALRILFGQDAEFESYKFVVRIEIKITRPAYFNGLPKLADQFIHICSSAFLTPTWILTAAHCFEKYDEVRNKHHMLNPRLLVRYGTPNPQPNSSFSDIVSVRIHPGFKISTTFYEINVENDIALAKTNPVKLGRYGRLSAVDYSSIIGMEVVTAGYGLTEDGQSTLKMNKMLQVLNVIINKCPKDFRGTIYPCTYLSGKCGQVGSMCPGDSGGPVIHSSGIVGVNSMAPEINCGPKWNRKIGTHNIVGIMCPVSPYIEWISNVIKKDKVSLD